jgi:hypothetical protein
MTLKDKQAINIYKRLKCYDLIENIDEYPEDERDGRSDMQFLIDEISYCKSCFEEEGHLFNYELIEARKKLRITENGKAIPFDINTLGPKKGYFPHDIERAKNVVAEYKQLGYYIKRLNNLGYYGFYQ